MEKVYDPQTIEAKWAQAWAAAPPTARPDAHPFSMVIPPPNVTGALHVGHALNNTLQDLLARWRRMRGDDVLWIPGTDHAGIATQNVVERQLAQAGESRHNLTRDAFIQRVWDWKAQSGGTIIEQLKRLGASCNWEQERFTMDAGLSRAVRAVFVQLYGEGLLYRAERLINWCTRCQTALSDIEVEHEETEGKLYHIRYPLDDAAGAFLTVATTRPETMLGDAAVAVHPDDPRLSHWIGHRVRLPLTHRAIPVVGDAILVDREFGTGAVKVTPGHDFNDEQAGKRHNLPIFSLFTPDGLLDAAGLTAAQVLPECVVALSGQTILSARTQVVKGLEEAGALARMEAHRHAVGRCYRCKTVVEPRCSLQWFVRVNDPNHSLAAPAIEAVRSRRVRLIPESWEANFFGWMEHIQDWCVSRQIWWGHPIPAWYCRGNDVGQCGMKCKEPIVAMSTPTHCPHCGSADLQPDTDVLDTWFSSALWPFSTLGWSGGWPGGWSGGRPGDAGAPDASLLARFYPTSVLVTSFDILFFWVARMMMMGLHCMKEVPFRTVYIHALVRDAEGEKMSKSRGNVVDPLTVMHQYGTDALRFTLAAMASPGRDIRLSPERIEGYRNFANKIWNAARFIQMNAPEGEDRTVEEANSPWRSPAERWIVGRLRQAAGEVNQKLADFRFDEAATVLYQFVWHEFCDWYLELAKVDGQDAARKAATYRTTAALFGEVLKLLHPFMPFITEELGQTFCVGGGRRLGDLPYPTAEDFPDDGAGVVFEQWVIAPVVAIRNLRGEMNLPPSEVLHAFLRPKDAVAGDVEGGVVPPPPDFASLKPYLIRLARLGSVTLDAPPPPPNMTASTARLEIVIPISETHRRNERVRLERQRAKLEQERGPLALKLSDPYFVRAPQAVQEKHRLRVAALSAEIARIEGEIARFTGCPQNPE